MPPKYWDRSVNAGAGCAPVGEKCNACWALKVVERMSHNPVMAGSAIIGPPGLQVKDGKWTGCVRWEIAKMRLPLYRDGHVVAIWWLGDLFMDQVPDEITEAQLDHTLADAMVRAAKRLSPNRYLYLSSRPQNMAKRVVAWLHDLAPPERRIVLQTHWWGSSVSDERSWEKASKALLLVPGNHWMSLEPWLRPINFEGRRPAPWDWINAGAETGGGARPAPTLDQFRELRDWCARWQVPFYLKQLNAKGDRTLDGREHNAFPWRHGQGPELGGLT